jgi:hypothetical protein
VPRRGFKLLGHALSRLNEFGGMEELLKGGAICAVNVLRPARE